MDAGAYMVLLGLDLFLLLPQGLTYSLVLSDDGQYGAEEAGTGNWSGLVGMLQRGVRGYSTWTTLTVITGD